MRSGVLGILLALLFNVLPVAGATLDFRFSFTDGTHAVTGLVSGLRNNATSPASEIRILSNTAGFGLGTYTYTISGPEPVFFAVRHARVIDPGLFLFSDAGFVTFGISPRDGSVLLTDFLPSGSGSVGGVQQIRADSIAFSLATVPLPAGGLLLLTALLGGGVVLRQRRAGLG